MASLLVLRRCKFTACLSVVRLWSAWPQDVRLLRLYLVFGLLYLPLGAPRLLLGLELFVDVDGRRFIELNAWNVVFVLNFVLHQLRQLHERVSLAGRIKSTCVTQLCKVFLKLLGLVYGQNHVWIVVVWGQLYVLFFMLRFFIRFFFFDLKRVIKSKMFESLQALSFMVGDVLEVTIWEFLCLLNLSYCARLLPGLFVYLLTQYSGFLVLTRVWSTCPTSFIQAIATWYGNFPLLWGCIILIFAGHHLINFGFLLGGLLAWCRFIHAWHTWRFCLLLKGRTCLIIGLDRSLEDSLRRLLSRCWFIRFELLRTSLVRGLHSLLAWEFLLV